MIDELKWIEDWYKSNCNGDWEHDFGIVIETLDNPGWLVKIDTIHTSVVLNDRSWEIDKKNENDWFGFKIVNHQYEGAGDHGKLKYILNHFRKIVS